MAINLCRPKLKNIIILLCVLQIDSAKYYRHPDADLSTIQKIKKDGYPVEIHEITTEDNYILEAIRLPYGLEKPKAPTNRSAVILAHGMAASPDLFFIMEKREALAYYFADHGFDVWAFGQRGTNPGKHKFLDWNIHKEYWNFSKHEVGVYDIPAVIDYVRANTGQQQVFYIGHSAGNTAFFITTSERPEYNDKVKIAVAYAPSTEQDRLEFPVVQVIAHLVNYLQAVLDGIGLVVLIPFIETIRPLIKHMCSYSDLSPVCINFLYIIAGQASRLYDTDLSTVVFTSIPQRTSAKMILHYLQLVKNGGFGQYDYGTQKNLRVYGRMTPPKYNLKNCTTAIAIMYAEFDCINPKEQVLDLASQLSNVVLTYQVPNLRFTHTDFLLAKNASKLVYERTSQLFHDYDNGKIQDKRKIRN